MWPKCRCLDPRDSSSTCTHPSPVHPWLAKRDSDASTHFQIHLQSKETSSVVWQGRLGSQEDCGLMTFDINTTASGPPFHCLHILHQLHQLRQLHQLHQPPHLFNLPPCCSSPPYCAVYSVSNIHLFILRES